MEDSEILNWKYLDSGDVSPAQWVSEDMIRCALDEAVMIRSSYVSLTFEIEISNNGDDWSSGIFLTVYNSSCDACADQLMPLTPTLCQARLDVCRFVPQC